MAVSIYTSMVSDGSMKSPDQNFASVLGARTTFLQKHTIDPADTTLVQVTYEGTDYCRYYTVDEQAKGDGMTRIPTIESDALVVTKPGHALFLPLADCVGAVLYDSTQNILMVSHLGRQNIEQHGGTKCVNYLVEHHTLSPADLTVWLSPAAGKESYPLYAFDHRSLHDVATQQLVAAGISPQQIDCSPIDSATDKNYFSHSQFLRGDRDTDGRFAVVAMLR